MNEIHQALDMLVSRGLVLERRGRGQRSFYQLNRARIADVTRFLEETNG